MDEKIEPNKNGNASEKAKNVSSNLYQPSEEIKQIADKEKGKKAEVILPNSEISESFFEGNKERNIQIPAMQEEIPPKTEMTKNFNHVLSTKAMSQNLGILQKMEKTKTFGRYTILDELGKGGMGRVFQAYDPKVDRKVALKLILSELNANQVELHRFCQEVRAMAKLNHPNIITLYDIGDEEGQPFFTMELIEGPSLKQLICRRTLSITQIVDIMKKVGSAVEYAHSKGIIHRDLKPANVIMTGFDEPKVMDFGLAKLIHEDTQISKSGAIIGTPQYMSPEQAEGKEIDTRTDIYALGAIMYEMLTKETTFTGNSTINLIYKIVNDSPVAPHKINHGVPKELEDICLKALQKKKEDRYPTAQAFVEALSLFEKQRIVKAVSKWDIHGWSKARQNRLVRAAIGLLIMLGLMFFYLKNEYKSLQNKKIEPDNKNSQISFIPEDKSPGDREQTIEKKPLQTISSENQNPDNATAQVDKKLPETNTTAQVDKKLPETNTTAQVDKKHPDTSTTAQVDKKLPETNTNAQVDKKLPDIIPNDSKGIESRKNIPDTNPKIEATQDNDVPFANFKLSF